MIPMKRILATVALLALAIPMLAQQSQHPSRSAANQNDQTVVPGRYITVRVEVDAPDQWSATIRNALEARLNAIPDVEAIKDADEAMFTIAVDVNAVTDKSENLLGYSLAATICGNYDQKFLSALFGELSKSADPTRAATLEVIQYAISGNVFLAGVVHTHGSTDSIDTAYDQVVSRFRSNGLPEARKMLTMLGSLTREQPRVGSSTRF
jgi:hypothetical protein